MLPTMTPTRISINATEMPTRMEIRLASKAKPIQIAAMNQMFSSIGRLRSRLLAPIIHHLHLLHREQAASHHSIERGQELLNLLLAIHDLDDQRQVHREPENLGGMQAARFPEPHRSTQHRRASQVHFTRLQHNGLVKWLVMTTVGLADEDTQEHGIVRN